MLGGARGRAGGGAMTAPRGSVGAADVAGAAASGAAEVMGAEPAGGGGAAPR